MCGVLTFSRCDAVISTSKRYGPAQLGDGRDISHVTAPIELAKGTGMIEKKRKEQKNSDVEALR
jgi:hypothetical protein